MNYSAKMNNKVERASNVLESNVRLNRNTGNRGKRTGWTKHDETGTEADWAARTGKRRATQQGTGRRNVGRKRATQRTGRKR